MSEKFNHGIFVHAKSRCRIQETVFSAAGILGLLHLAMIRFVVSTNPAGLADEPRD